MPHMHCQDSGGYPEREGGGGEEGEVLEKAHSLNWIMGLQNGC